MPARRLYRPGLWPGRSTVIARRGIASTSQPLATAAALDVFHRGGNAIDAAIAASATLAAVEPLSTGVGGDMFALYYSAKDKSLKGLNGSGRCPQNLSWRTFARKGVQMIPQFGWASVTVPGCVDGWWQMHQADGKLAWKDLFSAATEYCREGVPLSEVVAADMENIGPRLQNEAARQIFLPEGYPVSYAQVFRQQDLARTFELIAADGVDAFYRGEIAEKILRSSESSAGFFIKEDLAEHTSLWQTPVKATFRGVDIYELPPNSQGITALLALNILSSLDLDKLRDDWIGLTHATIEAIKLALAERNAHVADPGSKGPLEELLTLTFATHIGMSIDPERAIPRNESVVKNAGDTVYLCTADGEGNVVSLISSLFQGSGVVAEGTGIHFHNRASAFTLQDGHPNQMLGRKRPLHTLMPGFAMKNGVPSMAFGVMGGQHQAQGHVQLLVNLLLHEMGLQEAVSAPRFDFRLENFIALEADYPGEVAAALAAKGHSIVENDHGPFGGAQAIRVLKDSVYEAASDPRKDGCAGGF
ncbi:MAG TPA: gamma-glutamyltransferase family protein [Planctomycetota bacterium]|nr:gamma-glutamyltransferase family protein [Planctomycetota bacterium]